MTDTITREQALKLADEAVAALKGWRHESECPPDEVHAICNAAIKYYIDQQAALAAPEPMVRYCPDCGSIGPVPATARDCCPDGQHARMAPENFAKSCRDTFLRAIGEPQPVKQALSMSMFASKADYDEAIRARTTT